MTENEKKDTVQDIDPFKNAVKKYLSCSTNDKVKDQAEVFKNLSEAIKNANDIPEVAYKMLFRSAISNMVRRFTNKNCKSNIKLLVEALSNRNIKLGLKYLSDAVIFSYPNNSGYISKITAKNSTFLIKWICELLMKLENMENEKDLVEYSFEALAAAGVYSLSSNRSKKLSQNHLARLRKKMNIEQLISVFKKLASNPESFIALCCLLYSKEDEIDKQIVLLFCDAFSKGVLLPKTKVSDSLISGTQNIIRKITKNEWEELIMPNIKKGMLRSPEVATVGVKKLIEYCSVDLSGYAVDIFKSISVGLISSDEILQGKITNASQKINILSAISKGTLNNVSSGDKKEFGNTASNVISKLSKPLSSEANESSTIAFYQCLGEWSVLLKEKCQPIINIFENIFKIPIAQEQIRYNAFLSIAKFMDCEDPVKFCPQLKKMSENVFDEKSNLTAEMIPLIYVLVKYEIIEKGSLSNEFYTKLCNLKMNDDIEIYGKLGKDGFNLLSKLVLLVTFNRPYDDKIGNYSDALLKLSIFGCLYPDFNVRSNFYNTIKKITKVDGFVFSDFVLNIFLNNIQNEYFEKVYLKLTLKNLPDANSEGKQIPAIHLVNVIKILTPIPQEDSVMLSMFNEFVVTLLLVTSLDKVFNISRGLWAETVSEYDPTLKILNSEEFKKILTKRLFEFSVLKVKENAIQSLVGLEFGRHEIADFIWKYFEEYFNKFEIGVYFNIPENDVKIYQTPENVLFNVSVMEDSEIASLDTRGMSKKEQAAEIALRKELAEKRRKEGKFTEEQKKAIAEELKKESEIRNKMKKLYEDIYEPLRLLNAASKANPLGVTKHFDIMYNIVIPLLQSEFVAPIAVDTLFSFRDAIFEPSSDYLHQLVIITTLRLYNSKKLIDEWCEESLEDQLKRMIGSLTSMCALVSIPEEFATEIDIFMDNEGMNASKLGFLLPLIEKIMMTKDFDSTIKTSLTSFLQDGVSLKFIKGEDVFLVPYLKLATMTLPVLIENSDMDLIKPCRTVLQNLASIMSECTIPTEKMEEFLCYLLDHLKEPKSEIRLMILNMFYNMHHQVSVLLHKSKAFKGKLIVTLSIIINDDNDEVNRSAVQLWKHLELKLSAELFSHIFIGLMDVNEFIRKGASNVILKIVDDMPKYKITIINLLFDLYVKHSKIVEAEYDSVGRLLRGEYDEWEKRSGITEALIKLTNKIESNEAFNFLKKVVDIGLLDHNASVRQKMLKAAEIIITKHGRSNVNEFYPFLEEKLASLSSNENDDIMRQGLVILLGTLTKYLDSNDEKVLQILMKLMSTLTTPSQPVQESVCSCLPALIASRPEDGKVLLKSMLTSAAKFSTYGERRGAAYGVAGIVKGLGIKSMKEQQVDLFLKNGFKNKKDPQMKEACCLLMEMLGYALGQAFEPYIHELLPELLTAYGDTNENVRYAAEDACNCIMSKISNFGVKLILPVVLEVIDKDAWRTKVVCVKLLGNMAITAPKQLSVCLASVVPKLIECLADSHSKVQSASEDALKKISTVIKNPEMLTISSHLIDALVDPGNKTVSTLTTILNIRFAHFIDTPSLSMMMPIVKRGFDEKSTDGRRMAANIIASIYQLADKRDMEHYLYEIMPGLKKSLFDPVPDIRAISAKAIGSIIKYALGETSEKLQMELLPWLSQKLISEESVVERSGAAQGLSEIYYGIGENSLDDIMPQIVNKLNQPNLPPNVRDGFTLMYIYLPLVFQQKFIPYLSQVIPSILRGLSDENEFVRDSSLKAGQRLINQFCTSAQKLLLPQLQTAITDSFWRIRHAAVTLIGDLLFTVSGVSGKMTSNTAEEDDTFGMDEANSIIIKKLGQETRDQIFASLYLCRNDTAGQVRTAATHVWKIVVSNTPKTIKEIMGTLFSQILDCLSSTSEDRQVMAGKCLGELVKKMGEKVMTHVLPVITKQLDSDNPSQRQGVAIALGEIVDNTNSEIVSIYAENLIDPIRRCLSDENEDVRESAVTLFTAFYKAVGNIALDEIVVPLLKDIDNKQNSERVIGGLCAVVQSNSRQMMSYLLPKLTKPPVNVVALCKISAAAGDSLGKNLPKILEALLDNCENTDNEEQIDNCLPVLLSVDDYDGIAQIISTLLNRATSKNHIPSAMLLARYISEGDCEFEEFVNEILPGTLSLYNSPIPEIVESAIRTLIALTSNMEQSVQFNTIPLIQSCIQKMLKIGGKEQIPGFDHPKGISPFLPILREGIINGGVELKQKAGEALGNIVLLSTQASLKSHVVNATGPLIRVLGDRYPPEVKIAIIQTLSRLLDKVINLLSAFLPQLQSTFIKAIQEPSSKKVRLAAGGALAKLIQIHPKPENIVNEFVKLLSNLEDENLLLSTVISFRALVKKIGFKLSETCIESIINVGKKYINSNEDVIRACGALYGETVQFCSQWPLNILTEINKGTSNQKLFNLTCIQLLSSENANKVIDVYGYENISNTLSTNFSNESAFVADASIRSAGYILISMKDALDKDLLHILAKTINHNSNDVKRLVAIVIQNIFKNIFTPSIELLKTVVPSLVNGTKERNLAVRVSSEHALLEVFKLRKNDHVYEEYLGTLTGGVKAVLVDTYQKQLIKALKNTDDSVESLDNMLSVE
ncbi:Translational activator GCN1 [Strongyloides ratti]|uniref:Translational activator GCN1 n=1 Tax=Strongyloides ratti TaxID=34506 RepID=A0A090L1W1_STRRB|nr:Translational activator GCN1 [Strongyloides ratti]CEF63781.1 Translational activator GCN1 [Strongyloides ratti]